MRRTVRQHEGGRSRRLASTAMPWLPAILALGWLLAGEVRPAAAEHYVQEGLGCYACHTLDESEGETNTSYINRSSRTMLDMKSAYNPGNPKVREVCWQVYTLPIRRSKVKDILYFLRSILTSRPFLIERDDLTEMRQLVKRLLSAEQYDIIHCDQLSMAQFAFSGRFLGAGAPADSGNSTPGPIRVFDAHNAVWTIIERMRLGASWLMRPVYTLEARRIKRYEGMLV